MSVGFLAKDVVTMSPYFHGRGRRVALDHNGRGVRQIARHLQPKTETLKF